MIVVMLFLGFDVCAACGATCSFLTLYLPLWGAVLLGIPLGLVVVALGMKLFFATGSADSMDIVVTHVIIIVMAVILLPVFSQAREKARRTACIQNLHALGTALLMYTEDWDNTFPPAIHWGDATISDLQMAPGKDANALFHCPDSSSTYSYGFNISLDRLSKPAPVFTEQLVMLYESNVNSRNAAGDRNRVAHPLRHSDANNYEFADGHTKSVKNDATPLQWTVLPRE
jgi:type II secretory pathway pseudopilin PulG